jgi:L-aminopeptidase/D-esterase-like protein
MARSIVPVHTTGDGDTIIAVSKGEKGADLNTLGTAAAEAVWRSIVRAVEKSVALGGLPGLAGA